MENNEKFKLVTKRGLAWGLGGLFGGTIAFTAGWGVVYNIPEFVTLAIGIAGTSIGLILGFYFAKKLSEE